MSNPQYQLLDAPRDGAQIDVSVIIPVYNCEKFIAETVASVREQSIEKGRCEIIAVDDGSSDSSLAILTDLAKEHEDLRVFTMPNSGSAASPRNRGIDEAAGRYLFFLDADDKLDRDTLQRMVHTADTTGSGVILCKLGLFGEGKLTRQIPSRPFSKSSYAVDFIESKANSTLSALKLFRRSIIDEHNIRFPLGFMIGEDQPFTLCAFLHSPHVSILADKVYYWVRQRNDGTNVTSVGQSPRKHLDRILSLITTIVDNTEPGIRRDVLLRRPFVGKAGTLAVFGRKMLPAHGREEREEMLSLFRERALDLWNPRVRMYGAASSQVLVDLVVRNDLDEIERVSELLRTNGHIPLDFDWVSSEFHFLPSSGDPIGDLNLSLRTHLSRVRHNGDRTELSAEIGVQGAFEAPYSADLVMRHRQSGVETPFVLDVSRTNKGTYGVRSRIRAEINTNDFPEPGIWDTFVHAEWGTTTLTENLGHLKANGIDTQPVLHGMPTHAATFFTPAGNFAIDVGPTAAYLNSTYNIRPVRIGRFSVGKNEITELHGVHSDLIRATAQSKRTGKVTEIGLIRHRGNRASVIVPRAVTKNGPYTIALYDSEDRKVRVTKP